MRAINETTGVLPNKKYLIIESASDKTDVKIIRDMGEKVIFKAILQTVNEINRNKRYYSKQLMEQGIVNLIEEMKNRNLVGELDHPLDTEESRQAVVLYKEVSHIITDYFWKGNELWGVIETTPYSTNGKILTGLVRDGVKVGFSMRGFGDVIPKGDYMEVVSPLYIVTWDCVSNPSHKGARIQEITNEGVQRIINEGSRIQQCKDGKCGFAGYLDTLIENKINQITKILRTK
jgi:hypothetical protein